MTFSEQLTENFYHWERYCRGWYIYDDQVQIEPPFSPFHHLSLSEPIEDDGRGPSLLKLVSDIFKKPQPDPHELKHWEPFWDESEYLLKSFTISISQSTAVKVQINEQLLLMLSLSQCPISFEIVAKENKIYFQIVCRNIDLKYIQAQIKGYFPGAVFIDNSDELEVDNEVPIPTYFMDFCLMEEVVRPLSIVSSFDPDPLTGIISVLETLEQGDFACIQIQFSGVVNPWALNIMRAITVNSGESFFSNAPEMVSLAKIKTGSPLVAANIKVIAQSYDEDAAVSIASGLSNVLKKNMGSQFNSLGVIDVPEYDFERRLDDFYNRKSHKLGMLLNIKELQTLVHLPNSSVISEKLLRDVKRTKSVQGVDKNSDFSLGINIHKGEETSVIIDENVRLKHTHVIGATGTGKSTFLITQIIQDVYLGNGVAVIDPHGDLIDSVLKCIPPERFDDVVLVDPGDSEYPIGFNILTAHSDLERDILSSDLVAVFKRLSTSWGDQMNSVFANAILAFLESSKGGTLIDLRRFLIEKEFRQEFLKTVDDPSINYYWQKEYSLLKTNSVGPILTRLDAFLRPKVIRNMVAQPKSLDFDSIVDTGKILLIKLSQGLIGNENSYLLGSFFITKFYQIAMARQSQAIEKRRNFFIYVDEFQNFITPSMSAMLSGARKYNMGLILAHQDMQQLTKQDSELAASLISNAGIRVCFRLGDMDAKRFEDGFSFFNAKDLQNLGVGQSICRIERSENDFNLETLDSPPIYQEDFTTIKGGSQIKYSAPRSDVEDYIKNSLGVSYTDLQEEKETEKRSTASTPEYVKETEKQFQRIEKIEQKIDSEETRAKLVKDQVETDHRYIQSFIKKMAQQRGYKSTVEEPLSGGGMVDVSLERNGKRIACEISITTKPSWELHNIQKCLDSGFDMIIVCSKKLEVLAKIEALAQEKLSKVNLEQVFFMTPEQVISYLDGEVANEASTEVRSKGYRVKTEYKPVSDEEMQRKRDAISKAIFSKPKKKDE
ncbi:MAG TPA: type IV secretion system DNA-binding domain-containing protein [Bacteroidia bacterium]|nr:type IV secretion system DNA-binding domain-containing protein [Bacteroidia bacterium]